MSSPVIEARALCKRFPVAHDLMGRGTSWLSAVEDVDFALETGQALGIVGESGSGKTTVARMLVGLTKPTAGDILYKGQSIVSATRAWTKVARRGVQIVFQDPFSSLDPRSRLRDVIAEGMWHLNLTRRKQLERSAELLETVGLSASMAGNFPHQLSGGQRQRVGIARALAAEPQVLVADEPVSALDVSVQGQILNLLRRLQKERNLTLIFITHDLAVARHMADRIVVMHLGKVVEEAGSDELFSRPVHPYTQALLSASLVFGKRRVERIVLEGELPNPVDPPPICRFASRCPRRIDQCVKNDPVLGATLSPEHKAACFNWAPLVGERNGVPSIS